MLAEAILVHGEIGYKFVDYSRLRTKVKMDVMVYSRPNRCRGPTYSVRARGSFYFPPVVPRISEGHGPHIIQGTSTDSVLLRKELLPGMLLIDMVVALQPLSITTFSTEEMSYFGCVIPYI
ncbi:hypothetical protein CK203_087644 [Vitis vinifera]|uniref:Uncharacterized protein n=1 Tax=Vitis vinifera TaxID=29760 RepID=A0A438C757_VITVI|nr:hypothetical protein CK203_087644 [Vitis vinifera]